MAKTMSFRSHGVAVARSRYSFSTLNHRPRVLFFLSMDTRQTGLSVHHSHSRRARLNAFFNVASSRPYKDVQGNWKSSSSYGLNNLDSLSSLAEMAKDEGVDIHSNSLQPEAFGDLRQASSTSRSASCRP